MAKVEVHIPEDLGLTKKERSVLKKSFERQLVEAIDARRAKQMRVAVRAKIIAEDRIRPRES